MPKAAPAFLRRDLPGFRWRSHDVSRLEGFSDAVFGFALTLLVVSLDVPRTFDDLKAVINGFPAFALCFLFLALIWNEHYKFCRRYGLDDGTVRFLTCVMLFLVLFYVYPLKFLFNFSLAGIFGGAAQGTVLTVSQFSQLLVFYGLGFAAVYVAMLLLYRHAYRMRDALELTELERFDTRRQMYRYIILISVGLLGTILACFTPIVRFSGMIYIILWPLLRAERIIHHRRRALLLVAMGNTEE